MILSDVIGHEPPSVCRCIELPPPFFDSRNNFSSAMVILSLANDWTFHVCLGHVETVCEAGGNLLFDTTAAQSVLKLV